MQRCLDLAQKATGTAAPNPLVGALLVRNGALLAEGWHQAAGGPHAEVACLRAFGDGAIPDDAILYVNLEPCAHHGRTPPCADLLIARGVKQVVVGQRDPFPKVAGRGIERLKDAGVRVTENVLLDECRWVQRRFLTSIERGRPHVILKWARSADGLLDRHPRTERGVQRISSAATDVLVHRWRSEEQAILVGSRTVVNDDPSLTVRHVEGRQPLRVVIDRNGITPASSRVYMDGHPTLLITGRHRPELPVEQWLVEPGTPVISAVLSVLHERDIRSVLVEGGAELLGHFIHEGLWDEARVIQGKAVFGSGTPAPDLNGSPIRSVVSGDDSITLFLKVNNPAAAWDM